MKNSKGNSRILYVAPHAPYPLDTGWNQRMFHILKTLSYVGDVHCLAYASKTNDLETEDRSPLRDLCHHVELLDKPASDYSAAPRNYWELVRRYVFAGQPYAIAEFPGASIARRVESLVEQYDLIWVERLYVADWIQKGRKRMIVDLDDIESRLGERRLSLLPYTPWRLCAGFDNFRLKQVERSSPQEYSRIVVCSEHDLRFFSKAYLDKVMIVPNGIDSKLLYQDACQKKESSLVFVANMRYAPNVDAAYWFAREIFPRILRKSPDTRLYLIGHDERRQLLPLHDGCKIIVTGRVKDVAPYVSRAMVSVVPLRAGSGTRIKVLESLALGTPVVSTSVGAEGLDLVPGKHLLLADDPEQFACSTLELLTSDSLRDRISIAGRDHVSANFTWDRISEKLQSTLRVYLDVRSKLKDYPSALPRMS